MDQINQLPLSKQARRELKHQQKMQIRQSTEHQARIKKIKRVSLVLAILVLIVILVGWWGYQQGRPGKLDDFTRCLDEKGAIFYGAFWCPHCQDQKKAFGRSERLLPYVECSLPSGQGQTATCQEAGIESYPTWEFADGRRESGNLSLEFLAEKTGCQLPS